MRAARAAADRSAGALLARAAARLAPVSENARLEAELLLGAVTGASRAAVMAHPERALRADELECFEVRVARRRRGEPLAYVLGRREFYSLNLAVDPNVLVPRPETERLVEFALARAPAAGAAVLDLGTGSGAIALALKRERPDLAVAGVDCSAAALKVARANAAALELDVEWIRSDWFTALAGRRFELIVSNPPYVASGDPHFAGDLRHEPRLALDGGRDGLDAYRAILGDADPFLAAGGMLLFEHGWDQFDRLRTLAAAHGFRLEAAADDLAGLPRVAG